MELINKYLSIINNDNSVKNLSDIDRLIKNHIEKLPFCNIPVLLHKDISLDLSKIIEKMVEQKKGGYCFEHNKIMYEALLSLGFDVKPLFARVLNNQKIDVPKTHRVTLLTYENEQYLIDVGFGFMSPNQPIKFGLTPTKTTLNTIYVIKQIDEETFELQIVLNEGFYTLYSFDFHKCNEMDFEVGNFYSHKHPSANFVKNLVLSTISDKEIRSLRNNIFHRISKNEKKEIIIDTLEKFAYILKFDFNYPIDDKDKKYLYEKFVSDKNS